MSIVGGLDVHRGQITFNYLDIGSGEVWTGRIEPADRPHLRVWLARRFAGCWDVHLAMEAGTGWRYVAEEITAAGLSPYLAEPAQTAHKRGPKKRAKSDRADAKLLRDLLLKGDLPVCWIPPAIVLDCRAVLECYRDLLEHHEGWHQRIRAVLFHHGVPHLGSNLTSQAGRAHLAEAMAAQLPATARWQIELALGEIDRLETELRPAYGQINRIARRMGGPRLLRDEIYGVGPITALALTCWLGGQDRGFTSRGGVRFTGLDVTVHSSDGRRSGGGKLSRQGPPILRWALFEAGKLSAQHRAPDHDYYAQVKDRIDGKRAAIAEARKITRRAVHLLAELGDDAFVMAEPRGHGAKPITILGHEPA